MWEEWFDEMLLIIQQKQQLKPSIDWFDYKVILESLKENKEQDTTTKLD